MVSVCEVQEEGRWWRRTGLSTSTTNELPSDSVVLGAGAAMTTLCAAAEATREARAKMAVRIINESQEYEGNTGKRYVSLVLNTPNRTPLYTHIVLGGSVAGGRNCRTECWHLARPYIRNVVSRANWTLKVSSNVILADG